MEKLTLETSLDELDFYGYSYYKFKFHSNIKTLGDLLNTSMTDLGINYNRIKPFNLCIVINVLKQLGFSINDYGIEYIEKALTKNKIPAINDIELINSISNKYFVKESGSLKNIKTSFNYFYKISIKNKIDEIFEKLDLEEQINSELFIEVNEYAKGMRERYKEIMTMKIEEAMKELQKQSEIKSKSNIIDLRREQKIIRNNVEKDLFDALAKEQAKFHHKPFDQLEL